MTLTTPASSTSKLFDHPALSAFGATSLILLNLLAPLASPHHQLLYHLSVPVSSVLVPVLLNVAGVWLTLTLLLGWSRRHPRLDGWVWAVFSIGLLWMLLKDWATLQSGRATVPGSQTLLLLLSGLLLAVYRLATGPSSDRFFRHARSLGATLLGFLALSSALLLAEILFFSWQARDLNSPRSLHQSASPQSPPPSAQPAGFTPSSSTTFRRKDRILWILFDELSYRQVYEHRYPGLTLPAFDRLAQTSTLFTDTRPAGMFTENVLPSLMTGSPVDSIRASPRGVPLELHDPATDRWHLLLPQDTVFQDALNAGYSTAIAGWFNPYCRILPQVLDQCIWSNHVPLPGDMIPGRSIAWNTLQPALHHLLAAAEKLHLRPHGSTPPPDSLSHQQDYAELTSAADRLVSVPSARFVLLHLPIPHPGGIYNRHTSTFALDQPSYLNNLVLCDLFLAQLRLHLELSGQWDDTTLVIMGDHSWRVGIWSNAPGWTPEEKTASDGNRFDDRPAYIVKLPHQASPARIEEPFEAVRTRRLFDNLLNGQIRTPQQLADWAAQAH